MVKIVDYNREEYEKKKSAKEAKKNSKVKSGKEYKFKVGIGAEDMNRRINKMVENMVKGHPAKITITARRWEAGKNPALIKNLQVVIFAAIDGLVNKDSSRAPTGLHTQINWNCNVTPKQNIKELLEKKCEVLEEQMSMLSLSSWSNSVYIFSPWRVCLPLCHRARKR